MGDIYCDSSKASDSFPYNFIVQLQKCRLDMEERLKFPWTATNHKCQTLHLGLNNPMHQ